MQTITPSELYTWQIKAPNLSEGVLHNISTSNMAFKAKFKIVAKMYKNV